MRVLVVEDDRLLGDALRIGLSQAFAIYDEADQLAVVRPVMQDLGLDPRRTSARAVLSTDS